jgi:hypothetical protein
MPQYGRTRSTGVGFSRAHSSPRTAPLTRFKPFISPKARLRSSSGRHDACMPIPVATLPRAKRLAGHKFLSISWLVYQVATMRYVQLEKKLPKSFSSYLLLQNNFSSGQVKSGGEKITTNGTKALGERNDAGEHAQSPEGEADCQGDSVTEVRHIFHFIVGPCSNYSKTNWKITLHFVSLAWLLHSWFWLQGAVGQQPRLCQQPLSPSHMIQYRSC